MPSVESCKASFQAKIAPGQNAEFIRILQEADTRLLESGRFGWCKTRISLTPASGLVTLPTGYASIIGAQIEGAPLDIRAEEHEFMPFGEGEIEVGNGFCRLIDQGFSGTDEARVYKVSGHLDPGAVLDCLVIKAPAVLYDPSMNESDVPAEATDETRCPDIGALKLACFACVYEEASDPGLARQFMADAYRILDNREKARRGEARQAVQQKSVAPGIRSIRHFR